MKECRIRPYQPEENKASAFYRIAEESFSTGAPWTLKQYEETLLRENLFFFVAELQGEIVGYIGGQVLLDEAEIYTVVVKKAYQKKSIAKQLLDAFKQACQKKGAKVIFLEVRVSNEGAKLFYIKNQFEKIALRKNYYSVPVEDALLMKCSLRKKEEDVKETNFSN